MGDGKEYTLTNEYKKSSYENDYYRKTILGRTVTLIITTVYRWGEFDITLTDEEKEKIMSEQTVCVNDYDFSFVSNVDGCEKTEEIEDFDEYNDEEKKAICEDIYEDVENRVLFHTSELEDDRGWDLAETIYEIVGGVELNEVE
tara:strand:- start:5979 stop:6410 length:432 start_codon:yes stop_codon:yes gene_type:complete